MKNFMHMQLNQKPTNQFIHVCKNFVTSVSANNIHVHEFPSQNFIFVLIKEQS